MAPSTLTLPGIGLTLPIVDGSTDDTGYLVIPDSDHAVHAAGEPPIGAPKGTTSLFAHADYPDASPAPMARIGRAKAGMTVYVSDAGGRVHTYTVTELRKLPKEDATWNELAQRNGPPRLALVTCDTRSPIAAIDGLQQYADLTVLTATPTEGTQK